MIVEVRPMTSKRRTFSALVQRTPVEQRQVIAALRGGYPVQTLCQVLGYAPSSYYYQPVRRDEQSVVTAMEAILLRWPYSGYRRV